MAFEIFAVRATINLGMQGMSGLMAVATQFGMLNAQTAKLQARLSQIRGSLMAGAVVGIAMGAGLLKAANAAGDLAMNLKAVQVTGRFTNQTMEALRQTVFDVSGITARSAADVANWMNTIESSTSFTAQQLAGIMPTVAKFADIMYFTKHVPFEEYISVGARFAHMFQMYKPEELAEGLRMFTAVLRTMPGGPGEVMTGLTRFSPVATALHVPPAQQLACDRLSSLEGRLLALNRPQFGS
jgi:hypothetical protein